MPSIQQGILVVWAAPESEEPVQYHASYSDPLAQEPYVYGFKAKDLLLLKAALEHSPGVTLEQAMALAAEVTKERARVF